MISFSVVIPTYQRPKDLARCLDRLAPGAQILPFEYYEVIVTDDEGDGSETQELVQDCYPWAQRIAGPGQGPAANRNHGAEKADGEWLVFTDDDCLPDKQWLEAFWQAACSNDIHVLEGATVPEGPKKSLAWGAPINESGGLFWTCNLAVKKSCFLQIGGFDEDFSSPAMEDVDFQIRLAKSDFASKFVGEAEVVHPWVPLRPVHKHMEDVKSLLLLLHKHPRLPDQYNWTYAASPLLRLYKRMRKDLFHHKLRGGFASLLLFVKSAVSTALILRAKTRRLFN